MATRMAWGHVRRFFPHVPRADKEDMVQEAVINVWRKAPDDAEPGLISAIARTGVIDAARKMLGRRERARTALSHQVYLDAYEENDQLLGSHHDEYPSMVKAVLGQMKPSERAIFRLYQAGYEGQEIAAAMGIVPSRVSQIHTNGRRRAIRYLEAA